MTAPDTTSSGRHRASVEQGVIHDIGYRHYVGRRLGRGPIMQALFVDTLRGSYGLGRSLRSKLMPLTLLAMVSLPAVIIVFVASATGADKLPVQFTSYTYAVHALVLIFVAGQAPQCVSRDLRFRVMTLYFSRPLRRGDYVTAKFAAMTSAVFALLMVPLTILLVGSWLAKLPFWAQLRGYSQAAVGALLVALVLAGISLVIAAVTPRRGLGVAAIITVLLVSSAVQSAVQAVAEQQHQERLAGWSAVLSPMTLVEGVQSWLFDLRPDYGAPVPGDVGGLVFCLVTVAVVLGSFGLLLLRYRRVSVS